MTPSPKVDARHLKRNAYLYVRQSTLRQVVENTESTARQYALRSRAVSLGWAEDQIVVIDSDLGKSGAHSADRIGFQKLVAEVGMNQAGIVLGLEVSRLARSCTDWHRLLELCAYNQTLILDEEGVYDPTDFNDRLVLGLKGTMSEAELHVLRSRLRGGILNKARRGQLRTQLPIGFAYDPRGQVVLDPDRQVRETLELFFATYLRLGSACATVKALRDNQVLFPRRVHAGPNRGQILWRTLNVQRAVHILHNPRYAGAYVYGRRRSRCAPDGTVTTTPLPRHEWTALMREAHPGYISWDQFELIQSTLTQTAKAYGSDRRHGPPREGPALLQGRVLCGRCGARMTVRYHSHRDRLIPEYCCCDRGPTMADSPCQSVLGVDVDEAVGKLVLEAIEPHALQLAIAVQQELGARLQQLDRQREAHVLRAQHEADVARRRYLAVDPNNRLVADSLEADWNDKLRAVREAQLHYEQQRRCDEKNIDDQARKRIAELAHQLPAVWNDPATPVKQRKRLLGYLIEDVTLVKTDHIVAHVRMRGGATRSLHIALRPTAWELRSTNPSVLRELDGLLDEHDELHVAEILNERGRQTGADASFSRTKVKWICFAHGFKSHKQRLRERGMVTTDELCELLGVGRETVRTWRTKGLLNCRVCNARGEWMHEVPSGTLPPVRRTASTAGGAV
jgi:DNA invertase Pin-like site-specific DNA recombinase